MSTTLDDTALLLHLVDLVLAVSLLELLWLLWLLWRRPVAVRGLLPNLLAGLSLMLALRLGLGGAGLAWVAACLAAAGMAHLLDLQVRLKTRLSPEEGTEERREERFPTPTPTHAPGQGRQLP